MICDPYDEYIDIQDEIRSNLLNYSFIPIIDPIHDSIRYTVSKYSKGLRKFFDPHKVIKAIYTINHILFYINEENDIKKKYLFKIGSINVNDMIPSFCKMASLKNGINSDIYLAFFIEEENLPFTFGACKEDFYLLKDILNKICFKGTTPLKYMIFKDIKEMNDLNLKQKEIFAYNNALLLTNLNKKDYCKKIGIEEESLDKLLSNEVNEVKAKHHKKINKALVKKYLNIIDNVNELRFYEKNNLIWKVQYKDIPDVI